MLKKTKSGTTGVITSEEIKMFVTVKMQMAGLDVRGYAETLKVPHQTIYAILAGDRLPSKSLLEKLGLEIVYRIMPESGKK
jgi:hypothetical protein